MAFPTIMTEPSEDCVFCKIVNKEIPAYKLYEDGQFLAFLDINPLTAGHTLVIPKKHYRWTCDVPNFGEYFETAKKVAGAAKTALGADWICFLTIGLDVPHAHIHVIPRYENDRHGAIVQLGRVEKFDESEMRKMAQKISGRL